MVRNISLGALAIFEFVFLKVDRNRDVRNSTIGKSSSAGEINDVFYMTRAHHALVVNRHVHEEPIEGDVLPRARANHIVKLQSRDGWDWLMVVLGIVDACQHVTR